MCLPIIKIVQLDAQSYVLSPRRHVNRLVSAKSVLARVKIASPPTERNAAAWQELRHGTAVGWTPSTKGFIDAQVRTQSLSFTGSRLMQHHNEFFQVNGPMANLGGIAI